MPRLNETQLKRLAERERKKVDLLKKKSEIQKKTEDLGEGWKKAEKELLQKSYEEFEAQVGSLNAPKIYDTQDLYDFFDPIRFYKDGRDGSNGKPLNMDFDSFIREQKEYKKQVNSINSELKSLDDGDNTEEKNAEEKRSFLEKDGTDEIYDSIIPVTSTDGLKGLDETVIANAKANSELANKKYIMHRDASMYFGRFVPLYNKYVCSCCGAPKKIGDFYIVNSPAYTAMVDTNGNFHAHICKNCVQKIFMYYYSGKSNKNVEKAMQYTCSQINLYWDVNALAIARQKFETNDRTGTLIGEYIKVINKEHPGKTFMDSPFLEEKYSDSFLKDLQKAKEDAVRQAISMGLVSGNSGDDKDKNISGGMRDDETLDWSRKDYENKKEVIRIVGYDPFPDIKNVEDKKTLYKNLLDMIDDDDVSQDFIKVQSAITIVKGFYSARNYEKRMHLLEEEGGSPKELKELSELKKKELDNVTSFAASNGWSERYKTKVSKGENTFCGIMKSMNEKKYEDALVNKYDIDTSASMQQVADMSFSAVMKQLALSDSDVWKISQDQFSELVKIRKENSRLSEELRKASYEIAKMRLEEKARKEAEDKIGAEGVIG